MRESHGNRRGSDSSFLASKRVSGKCSSRIDREQEGSQRKQLSIPLNLGMKSRLLLSFWLSSISEQVLVFLSTDSSSFLPWIHTVNESRLRCIQRRLKRESKWEKRNTEWMFSFRAEKDETTRSSGFFLFSSDFFGHQKILEASMRFGEGRKLKLKCESIRKLLCLSSDLSWGWVKCADSGRTRVEFKICWRIPDKENSVFHVKRVNKWHD